MRGSHPDVAEMARAAAHVRKELRLVLAAVPEEIIGAFAANALGLEGQRAFESLQLKAEKCQREMEPQQLKRKHFWT